MAALTEYVTCRTSPEERETIEKAAWLRSLRTGVQVSVSELVREAALEAARVEIARAPKPAPPAPRRRRR